MNPLLCNPMLMQWLFRRRPHWLYICRSHPLLVFSKIFNWNSFDFLAIVNHSSLNN